MKRQMTIEGTDTELSKLADQYIGVKEVFEEDEKALKALEEKVLGAMKDAKIDSMEHEGTLFYIRRGRVSKPKLLVK